jgi:tetraacyldisaccharide 4'-kinase
MRPRIERLWRNDLPLSYWPLWIALTPLAAVYRGALVMRTRWWRRRMPQDAGMATVSVGNLTVGGNGKTPFTLFLAARLLQRGLRVGIASRGYGRNAPAEGAALVSDGARVLMSAREAGDEPVMMAQRFAGPIAVARRRIDAIHLLRARAALDLVIVDDGFQHVRLRRDLDLLLVNAARGLGNGWTLPAGPMREPRSAMGRADAIIMMCSREFAPHAPRPEEAAALASRPTIRAALRPRALVGIEQGKWRDSPPEIAGRRVLAVSGIADPSRFHAMIGRLGAEIAGTLDYPDHYDYGPADWENILAAARTADLVLTTEKDLVKLQRFSLAGVSLFALGIEVAMGREDEARLLEMVTRCVRERRIASKLAGPAG